MEEVVKQVASQTGISHDQAQQAVQIVVNTIKDRLPPQFASQVDAMLNGQVSQDSINQMLGGLGGMFGGNR
ncbi:MAG TPA: DUF2267 domain-containing protein [Roseiflexaceae bacterium]|jgi:uncharacterized protein (DUF2267 family)|nr:DUF2267 domain-containing protein [Roseiflexaceae bacterium]